MNRVLITIILGLTVALAFEYAGKANVEQKFTEYRAEVAAQRQKEQAAQLAEQERRQREAERIANELEKNRQALLARAARAESTVAGLRAEIALLNSRPAPTDPIAAALAGEARTARELLGQCATRYTDVAGKADELRDQVTGLQDFARKVLGSK